MKLITAIVRPEKLESLKEVLGKEDISGMMISQIHGCGKQRGWKEYYRGTEVLLNMVSKIKFEIVVPENSVKRIVDVIIEGARTGEVGDGKILVSPIEQVYRIRTGERDEDAL